MEVEVNATQRAIPLGLAEDDGDLAIEGNAMPEVRSAILVGFDGLLHQGTQGALTVLRHLINAHHVLLKRFQCLRDFVLKGVGGHARDSNSNSGGLGSPKLSTVVAGRTPK